MNNYELNYEPPKTKIYRFDDNDRVLTESSNPELPISVYAAEALGDFMGGTNTTVEKD